jgi:hypothetical protein
MKKLVMKLVAAVAGSAMMAAGQGSAFAGTISYTDNVGAQATSYDQTVQLQKFDTTLGTLTGVTISFSSNVHATLSVYNFHSPAGPQTFTNGSATVPISIVGPDNTTATANAVATIASGTVPSSFTPPGPVNAT